MKKRMLALGIGLICLLLAACQEELTPAIEEPAMPYVEAQDEDMAYPEIPIEEENELARYEPTQIYDLIVYVPTELNVIFTQGRELGMSVSLTSADRDSNDIGDHLWFGVAPERDAESLVIEPEEMHRDSGSIDSILSEGSFYVGGMPATYIEASFFWSDQAEEVTYGFLARVVYGEFRYDLVFRAPTLAEYEQYLPMVKTLIASIRFDSEDDPRETVTLGEITLEIRTRDVRTSMSERSMHVYCVRNMDRILRFYARMDDSLPFTETFFDHTPALDVLLRERTEPLGPFWEWGDRSQTINMLEPREVSREEIELNGTRAIRVVFHDDFRQFNDYVELILFIHNGVLYTLFGQSALGNEEALSDFLTPMLESVHF